MDFKNIMCMFGDIDIRLKWCYVNVWQCVRTYHYHSVQILTQEHFYRVWEQRWVQSQGSTQRVWCIWKDQSECRRKTKRRKNCDTLSWRRKITRYIMHSLQNFLLKIIKKINFSNFQNVFIFNRSLFSLLWQTKVYLDS